MEPVDTRGEGKLERVSTPWRGAWLGVVEIFRLDISNDSAIVRGAH